MAEKKRTMVSIPESTDKIVEQLAEQMDEPKGKIVKMAVEVFYKKVNK